MAPDEIEALRAENARLRAALADLAERAQSIWADARAALVRGNGNES